jgi:hypothetical protein
MAIQRHSTDVSTVTEIESAIAQLPPDQWAEIRRWMDAQARQTGGGLASPHVDWSQSAGVRRTRPPEDRVAAEVVMEILREGRD